MKSDPLPQVIAELVRQRSAGSPRAAILWKEAAELGCRSESSMSVLADWMRHFSSPSALLAFIRAHAAANESLEGSWRSVLESVDELGLEVDAYVAGVEKVVSWLVARGRAICPSKLLGYVYCAAEFASSKAVAEPFTTVMDEMLDRYGVE